MAGERLRPAERLAALEWREGEVVVDVGGGNGALLRELIGRRPELRGIVLDLPETVRDEAALGDRIEFVAGSFFESVPTATPTSCRGSSTTGPTTTRRGSCARSERPPRRTHAF